MPKAAILSIYRKAPPPLALDDPENWNALLAAVAERGDRSAFEALFGHFAPRLKSYLMRIGSSPDLAEDLAQEAMLKVWRKARLYDPSKSSASTWIFTIARNLRIDAARRAARPMPEEGDPDFTPMAEPMADETVVRGERDQCIRRAFENLPQAQYDVVALHFLDDATHSEIAARLRLPLGTVKSRLRLALEKIRSEIGDSVA
jgi:RNA polymerase sigma-70 factor (ECF subfamily)